MLVMITCIVIVHVLVQTICRHGESSYIYVERPAVMLALYPALDPKNLDVVNPYPK